MHALTIPFYGFELRLATGGRLITPMMYPCMVHSGQRIQKMAEHFRGAFQEKVVDKGDYMEVLNQFTHGDFYHGDVIVPFKASKDRISYPDLELAFRYYFKTSGRGHWVSVPALGVELFVEEGGDLDGNIVAAIRLEFSRRKRLKAVQNIVEAIWFDEVELQMQEVKLQFHTPAELEKLHESKTQELLPKVAKRLDIPQPSLYGMEAEMKQVLRSLKGKYNRNVLLVGPSGVGKTALVWELARKGKKAKPVADIWETTASIMIKELTQDTGWQENVAYLCKDLAAKGDVLFVRNLMELFEVGQYDGNDVSVAEYLKPYLANGEISLVSECTDGELAQIELKSPGYGSLFHLVRMEEPKQGMDDIILRKVSDMAKAHHTHISSDAVAETVRLNRRYTPYSGFPGKPIRFLEDVIIQHRKKQSRLQGDTPGEAAPHSLLNRSDVISYFCEETGMPPFIVDPAIPMKLSEVRRDFKNDLFGQDPAIRAVTDVFATVKTALARQGKPIASFLFVGPTGVGKTEMARIMANFMFGARDRIIRFDMSEYSTPYSVLRLTGLGQADGLLTSAIRREPFAVLLFDEIEKADGSFYDLLLQVLGEGRLTDGRGKPVNFCSAVIVMTSNIGAASLQSQRIGWGPGLGTADVNAHFMSAVEKHFRPELFNRIDRVIPFNPLGRETMHHVVGREMRLFRKREGIRFRKMSLDISEEVMDYIAEVGYDEKYGARHLQRAIRERLATPLARELNRYDTNDQLEVSIRMVDGRVDLSVESDPMQFSLMLEELQRNTLADDLSDLRRRAYLMQDSDLYLKLESELDILEAKKQKKKEEFWNNPKKSKEYTNLLKLKGRMEDIVKEIDALEMDLSLAVMDIRLYRPEATDDKRGWVRKFDRLKVDVYAQVNPAHNECQIAIMGLEPGRMLDFYLALAGIKKFEVGGIRSLWFRESHYHEKVEVDVWETTAHGKRKKRKKLQPRHDYLSMPVDMEAEHPFKSEKPKDLLCGVMLVLKAPAVFAYMQPEGGRVDWEITPKLTANYFIQVATGKPDYPKEVHRKEFFNKTAKYARREFLPEELRDNIYKMQKRATNKEGYLQLIVTCLDGAFRNRMDHEVMDY